MTPAVVSGVELREHPAVRAWRELGRGHARPAAVELRKKRRKSAVYRLVGAGPRGSSVVAKYCDAETGEVERQIYEELLPRLEVSALRCYGSLLLEDGGRWLFLEDAGEGKSSFEDREHRKLVARWAAAMHLGAATLAELQDLPDRGWAHYVAQLRQGRAWISRGARHPALTTHERTFLRELCAHYDRLEAGWPALTALCSPMPATLVHRDLRRANVRLRDGLDGTAVLVLDWEMAGRGIPAVDLCLADVSTYVDEVQAAWTLDRTDAARLAAAAEILRGLDAIGWVLPDLVRAPPSWVVDRLRPHAERLSGAMRML
jgi:hypothetical protein